MYVLSQEEMIDLWLKRKGLAPLRLDCHIGRSDAVDLEAYALMEIEAWYDEVLRTAPVELLEPVDVADKAIISAGLNGSALVKMPAQVVRPVAVKLLSWNAPAEIVTPDHPKAQLQTAGYGAAGGVLHPVAVIRPDSILELFSLAYNDLDTLQYLLCIVREYDDEGLPIYRFAPSLLPANL